MPFIDTKVSAKITEEDKKILTARLGALAYARLHG